LGILEVRPVNPLKTLDETEVVRLGDSENIEVLRSGQQRRRVRKV
jgi:hypothetical protein